MREPIELCLCEVDQLVLRINRPYIFIEGAGCAKCKEKGDQARKAYGEDGGEDYQDWGSIGPPS